MQVSVMHAFIDEGDYSNMTIDKALRMMLKEFKLPGELMIDFQGDTAYCFAKHMNALGPICKHMKHLHCGVQKALLLARCACTSCRLGQQQRHLNLGVCNWTLTLFLIAVYKCVCQV